MSWRKWLLKLSEEEKKREKSEDDPVELERRELAASIAARFEEEAFGRYTAKEYEGMVAQPQSSSNTNLKA